MEDGLNDDLGTLVAYFQRWRLQLNIGKTVAAAYHLSTRQARRELEVRVDNKRLEVQQAPKYLGVRLDRTLSFKQHLEEVKAKVTSRVALIRRLAGTTWGASAKTLRISTQALVFSAAEYCAPAWSRSPHANLKDVRLVNMQSRCAGALEVQHQEEWRAVSFLHSWSLREAAVVCTQLGCGAPVSSSRVQLPGAARPAWRFYSDCDGSEGALMGCGSVRKWLSSSGSTQVVCSDILLPPNRPVISTRGYYDDQERDVLLFKGHSFSLNCSVEPQYPGGSFSLMLTGSNPTSYTLPAVNHSAFFRFAAAEPAHQGNYSCVYHNYVFHQNFSAEGQSLSLILQVDYDVMLDDGVLREDDSEACAGRLLVFQEEWRLLSTGSRVWDLKHAALVCRQLGCGSAASTKRIDLLHNIPVSRFFSDCDGSESALMDCGSVQLWFSSTAIEVVCTGHQGAAGRT
ncbi:hypothetical protein JOQ06_012810 [Pogonophryne albipinna]|uniref:Uncharacterized protein n=1 Tax=Pogonophryne albipinna TaxID=1090488 RepID=A0AAD6BK47_9TELE|nr:hypothetical protein JOQ06_012810 [Pogonophryne albipinna]